MNHPFILLLAHLSMCSAETPAVLSRHEVTQGDHKITFERIAPPAPVERVFQPVLPATPLPPATPLSLSCTVHQDEMTEVRWQHSGQEYRILSSIDFNILRVLGLFEIAGRRYSLHLGIGNETVVARITQNGAWRASPDIHPALATFRSHTPPAGGGSWYTIVSAPTTDAATAFNAVSDLHRYYDAHEASLKQQHLAAETARIADAAWRKAHPPMKQDTVIRFWPLKSALHLPAAANGEEAAR